MALFIISCIQDPTWYSYLGFPGWNNLFSLSRKLLLVMVFCDSLNHMLISKHSKSIVHGLPATEFQSRLNWLCAQSLLIIGTKSKLSQVVGNFTVSLQFLDQETSVPHPSLTTTLLQHWEQWWVGLGRKGIGKWTWHSCFLGSPVEILEREFFSWATGNLEVFKSLIISH